MLTFLALPPFVDLYIGASDSDKETCTCICPFQMWQPVPRRLAYYVFGMWNTSTTDSYLGHRLIFVPCYLIGSYFGKYIFPLLCRLSKERDRWRRVIVGIVMVIIYL